MIKSLKLILLIAPFLVWTCAPTRLKDASVETAKPGQDEQLQSQQEILEVYTGLDVLSEMNFEPLLGLTVGVITNHTAVSRKGEHLVDLLHAAAGVTVGAIFAPEHGFRGNFQGGDAIPGEVDAITGAPIYSLYGTTRKPDAAMLQGLDILIFDIQDVGARFYTYISTMGTVLEAGAQYGLPVMILDRPDPIGRELGGNVLDEGYESFVGRYKIPIRYGMTVGELARMIIGENMIPGLGSVELHVVECEGWQADSYWQQTDLTWIPTSPNMRNTNETLTYPGLCLLEGVRISEGRGTDEPFEIVGTPYMDADLVIRELQATDLQGFSLEPVNFIPVDLPGVAMNPIFKGEEVHGFRIKVTDPASFKPVEFLIHLLVIIKKNYPEHFGWRNERGPDRLWGGAGLRKMIDAGYSAAEIIASYQVELEEFAEIRDPYLIYK